MAQIYDGGLTMVIWLVEQPSDTVERAEKTRLWHRAFKDHEEYETSLREIAMRSPPAWVE